MYRSYLSTLSQASFPAREQAPYTLKNKSNYEKKRVQFSDMSSMVVYEDASPGTDLHYSASDYSGFKKDAFKSARRVRRAIKESQAPNTKKSKSMKKTPLKCYTESWTSLPQLLKEYEIDTADILGVEHLVVGKDIASISRKLRDHCAKLMFEEQTNQEKLRCSCPERLADTTWPFTEVSVSIALARAKNAEH